MRGSRIFQRAILLKYVCYLTDIISLFFQHLEKVGDEINETLQLNNKQYSQIGYRLTSKHIIFVVGGMGGMGGMAGLAGMAGLGGMGGMGGMDMNALMGKSLLDM